MSKISLYEEYFELQQKYEKEYGEKTVVLMQNGNFYEIFEYEPSLCNEEDKMSKNGKKWNDPIGHAQNISVILRFNYTCVNKNKPHSIRNPNMIGFPTIAYDKHKQSLLSSDYVIVRIDEVKSDNKSDRKVREVKEICNPHMQMDNINANVPRNNIICIYIEYQNGRNVYSKEHYQNFIITTGIAILDILTGTSKVCEFHSKIDDEFLPVQEIYRFLISHYPKELILYVQDLPNNDNGNYVKYLETALELYKFDKYECLTNSLPEDYRNPKYQIEFFNNIFTTKEPTNSIVNKRNDLIIDTLGLSRMNYGTIAYISLLQHCFKYNKDIIKNLSFPDVKWLDDNKTMILTHNAISQLEIISNTEYRKDKNKVKSLISILNQNCTLQGTRALESIIQNPHIMPEEIIKSYDCVDDMMLKDENNKMLWEHLDKQLKELADIGKLHRKLEIRTLSPKEFRLLYNSYIKIINIYNIILSYQCKELHNNLLSNNDAEEFNGFVQRFGTIINIPALASCNIEQSTENDISWIEFETLPLNSGYVSEIDELNNQYIEVDKTLHTVITHLNSHIKNNTGTKITIGTEKKNKGAKKYDPKGTVLIVTDSKANILKKSIIDTKLCGELNIIPYSSTHKIISSPIIQKLCSDYDKLKMKLKIKLLELYQEWIEQANEDYKFYNSLSYMIGRIDLWHCYAKLAIKYNYHRPTIIQEECEQSYCEFQDIRHPIIERIIDYPYVTNDLYLGNGNDKRSNGILLYGVNQTGKTSLAKAVAINIIMAQAGCFTPSKLTLSPYHKIITRLTKNDNMFQGQSTYAVEVNELRTILRQADSHTLVLGDELCSGTETRSAIAMTVSTIKKLIEMKSTFIFGLHLHELLKIEYIKNIPSQQLQVCHLTINYDEKTETLIYDRKLKPGSGPVDYGIMVAKALYLPDDFIRNSFYFASELDKIKNSILPCDKVSKYNNDVYIYECCLCNKSIDIETHHIIEQKYADNNGFINNKKLEDGRETGHLHKNIRSNLLTICKNCHSKLHATKQELQTFKTAGGTVIKLINSS